MIPLHNLFEDIDDVAEAFKSFKGDPSDVKMGKKFFKDTNWMPFNDPGARRAEGYNAAMKKVAADKEAARIKKLETEAKSGYQKGYDAAQQNKDIKPNITEPKSKILNKDIKPNITEPKSKILNKDNVKLAGGVATGIGAGALINKQINKQK